MAERGLRADGEAQPQDQMSAQSGEPGVWGWQRSPTVVTGVSPGWGIRALGLAKIADCSDRSQPGVGN